MQHIYYGMANGETRYAMMKYDDDDYDGDNDNKHHYNQLHTPNKKAEILMQETGD